MSKPVNKTMIGLFVVGAIALVIAAVGILGSGKFFRQQYKYYMVFEGSVKGLNVGAPVVFRGVKVGTVSAIHMNLNYATKALTVVVYADLDQTQVQTSHITEAEVERLRTGGQYVFMKEFIHRGLRAQLEMQSIVTGQLQIGLDFYPDTPAVYTGIEKTIQEIPTIPTPFQQLAKKLETLPIDEIVNKLNAALEGIVKLVQSPDLHESIANLNIALKDVQTLLHNVDAELKPMGAEFSETLRDTRKLIKNADSQVALLGSNLNKTIGDGRKLIQKVDSRVDPIAASLVEMTKKATATLGEAEKVLSELQAAAKTDSGLMYGVIQALSEVEKAARSLRILTEYLERHPDALIWGKGEPGGK